ncbi:hypothetical protein J6590_053070 [Homalodisca vitripennis]|nr:hypothetical protein J6590_053070 [Homalodisca vitripennis]
MLDISNIDHSHFTPHGLHLRAKDRRYDASVPSVTAVTAPIRSTPSPTPYPVTLPSSTYAKAVIGTSQPSTTDILNASMKTYICGEAFSFVNASKNSPAVYSTKIDLGYQVRFH